LSFSPARRRLIAALPRFFRVRAAVRAARDVALAVSSGSRVSSRVRGASVRMEFASSLFCAVRGVQTLPLCGFYRALAARTLAAFDLPAQAHVAQCRAMGADSCVIVLDIGAAQAAPESAVAA
jgi:predicted hydrocarbon binding protein